MGVFHLERELGAPGSFSEKPFSFHYFLTSASCLGIFNIPSGLNLISCLQERRWISRRVNLPGRGSEGRERPSQHHPQTHAASQVSSLDGLPLPWHGLNPALPGLRAPDRMTACGEEGVS